MKKNGPAVFILGLILTQATVFSIFKVLSLPFLDAVIGSAITLFLWLDGWSLLRDDKNAA